MSKTTNIFELLRAYFAVISARYRTLLQYRAAAFAGFVTQLFWGAIRIMIFAAFYAVTSDEQPMSFTMVVSYVWLGQALLGILPWNIDTEIAEMIRSGSVSYELARPLDLYNFWFCRTIALRTATTTLRCVPMFIVAVLLLPALGLDGWAMQLPPTCTASVSSVDLLRSYACFCADHADARCPYLDAVRRGTQSDHAVTGNRLVGQYCSAAALSRLVTALPEFPALQGISRCAL